MGGIQRGQFTRIFTSLLPVLAKMSCHAMNKRGLGQELVGVSSEL